MKVMSVRGRGRLAEDQQRLNIVGMEREAMQGFFATLGAPEFHARQVLQWVYQRGVSDFSAMTDLSKTLRVRLKEIAKIGLPDVVSESSSADGTRKWLLRLVDGNCIETVFIPEEGRGTLCVSSQVGCALNCSFCATARQGFNRNLDSSEIISQLLIAKGLLQLSGHGERPITNVVMMGMGEPLLNYQAVISAMRLMLDDLSFGLSRRRVTLSTAGVVPAIRRLSRDCPVSLAVSLHATDDALRDKLVPLNRKYPIRQVLEACKHYLLGDQRRRVTFEYVMLKGANDSKDDAHRLCGLLDDVRAKVNLIPFNPVPGVGWQASESGALNTFRDVLLSAGIMTVTRRTRGADIEAACGQLAGQFRDRTQRRARL